MNFAFTNSDGIAVIVANSLPETVVINCDGDGSINFTLNGEPFFMKAGDTITIN